MSFALLRRNLDAMSRCKRLTDRQYGRSVVHKSRRGQRCLIYARLCSGPVLPSWISSITPARSTEDAWC